MANVDSVLIESGLQILKSYAARGETLSYGGLNRELGEPYKLGANFPGQIGKLCDDINAQHAKGTGLKVMISVLVRNEETGQPGEGFFKLAASIGDLPFTDDADARRAFVQMQERRVFMVFRPVKATTSGFGPNH